jgi:hypothetical protein
MLGRAKKMEKDYFGLCLEPNALTPQRREVNRVTPVCP